MCKYSPRFDGTWAERFGTRGNRVPGHDHSHLQKHSAGGFSRPWGTTLRQLKGSDAERPNIGTRVILNAGNELWRHPAWLSGESVSTSRTCDTTMGITDSADERPPLANSRAARCDVDILVKENDARWFGILMEMGVILVVQWCSDSKVTQEDSAVIINEEVGRFNIPMDKPVDVQVTIGVGRDIK